MVRVKASRTFGWSNWPVMPISLHKSLVPTSSMSMPGTAAIASTFSSAATASIITTTMVASFIAAFASGCGKLRYW